MPIVYSKLSGKNDAMYGKFEHPIKALIQNESNALEKKKSILDVLYNVEKSNRYAETVMGQSDFDVFQSVKEGQGAENDSVESTFKKTIEHIAFMKEFTITKEMVDDAKFGMGSNMKSKPQGFVRAYYKTRTKIAAWALANGTKTQDKFGGKTLVDLAVADGKPLFHNGHTYSLDKFKGKTQSNYFYSGSLCASTAEFEKSLGILANKMRNFKDENGESLDYVPDILILPCNRPELEQIAKKVVGSERTTNTDFNDINTQYGNWTIVILPGWETTDDRFMLMSSDANKQLLGSMFYNRVNLDIRNYIDEHTRNFVWNGYCRFGIGFTTWKHMLLAVDSDSAVTNATAL
nr:MAG TPA: Major capsid protein [Caudoviricetes sp.]